MEMHEICGEGKPAPANYVRCRRRTAIALASAPMEHDHGEHVATIKPTSSTCAKTSNPDSMRPFAIITTKFHSNGLDGV